MGAAHIIGQNLEARHRISLRLVAEHEVAYLLIRVCLMRSGFDLD